MKKTLFLLTLLICFNLTLAGAVDTNSVKEFTITANQGEFQPNVITVAKCDRLKLNFTRDVDIADNISSAVFGGTVQLQPNGNTIVQFIASTPGSFDFVSGDGSVKGTLTVIDVENVTCGEGLIGVTHISRSAPPTFHALTAVVESTQLTTGTQTQILANGTQVTSIIDGTRVTVGNPEPIPAQAAVPVQFVPPTKVTPNVVTPPEPVCNGCKNGVQCLPFGNRVLLNDTAMFCELTGNFTLQFLDNATCQNSYECQSNTCASAKCIDLAKTAETVEKTQEQVKQNSDLLTSLTETIHKILNWLGIK
ncbi:MAG: cupredoxin domain-containing protein [Candidatus Micrarchaeota archaeon]